MIEYIIKHYCNNSRFINDFEKINEYFEENDLDIDLKNKILKEIFNYNKKMYKIICDENKQLEDVINKKSRIKAKKEMIISESEPLKVENIRVTLDIDVKSFIDKIKNCEDLNLLEQCLPAKNIHNYNHFINVIILNLYEEIYVLKKLLYQERNNIEESVREEFEGEIIDLKTKAEYLKQLNIGPLTKKVSPKVVSENKLIFLKTAYGNICSYSDIKEIYSDQYDYFIGLLNSIKDGSLKKNKNFTNNNILKGLSEVRDEQARIIYDRIDQDKFVIIYMFIKKVDISSSYRAALVNRSDLYNANKSTILELMNNEEFLEENKQIEEKTYALLNNIKYKK